MTLPITKAVPKTLEPSAGYPSQITEAHCQCNLNGLQAMSMTHLHTVHY